MKIHFEPSIVATKLERIKQELDENLDQLSNKKQEYEALHERYQDVLDSKAFLAHDHGHSRSNVKASDIIELDVQGTQLFARRDTLTAVKGSRLEALFSGRWEKHLLRNIQGAVCIDVDEGAFRKILEYLYIVKISDDLPSIPSMDETLQVKFDSYAKYFSLLLTTRGDNSQQDAAKKDLQESSSPKEHADFRLRDVEVHLEKMKQEIEAERTFIEHFTKHETFATFTSFMWDNEVQSEETSHQTSDDIVIVDTDGPLSFNKTIFTSFLVNGEVLKYRRSTFLADPTSKLARDLGDEDWLQQNCIKTNAGELCILIEQPPYAFKKMAEYLNLKLIDADVDDHFTSFFAGDLLQKEYFTRMVNHFFLGSSDFVSVVQRDLNSFPRINAADFHVQEGIKVSGNRNHIGYFDDGNFLSYKNVNFSFAFASAHSIKLSFSKKRGSGGGWVEIRLGGPSGKVIGDFIPFNTGGWGCFQTAVETINISNVQGVHDLTFVARDSNKGVMNLAWFQLSSSGKE